MADLFASPKQMFRRAKHHISDLSTQIDAFTHDKPWSHVVEKNVDGITDHKVKFNKRLSDDLPSIAFDAANNLRSVLDQMAFAIAVNHTGINNPKSAKFPFGPTKPDMINNAKGACKDLPPIIQVLFESFCPYKGGNNALWALNELANTPKHKMIVPLAIGGGITTVTPKGLVTGSITILPPQWDREKNEIVFLSAGHGSQISYDANVSYTVALDDIDEIIRGQHPVAVLNAMASEVERVLMTTEAECRRIGLIN